MKPPNTELVSTVIGAPDPISLARFYRDLLGWEITYESPEWVKLRRPDTGTGLSFQLEGDHTPPVWPAGPKDQQMQMHLDIWVDDLGAGVMRAQKLGARLSGFQPQDNVRVMLDPAGHPFCLFAD
jgi:catechol 2,3-dioxygenase-like lactoylglutathione lyase family enzyme